MQGNQNLDCVELIREMERRWETGECPRLQSYLDKYPGLSDDCVCALALVEIKWRQDAGEAGVLREYRRLFSPEAYRKLRNNARVQRRPAEKVVRNLETFPGYETLSYLGGGTFGKVYLARSNLDGADVAIKVLTALSRVPAAEIASIVREFYILKKIPHNNIVKCYEFVDAFENRDPFFTMELIGGAVTVVRAFRQSQFLHLWLTWALQLAGALQALHGAGFVHRDLKPTNVLVGEPELEIKVIDAGLSARLPVGQGDDPSFLPGAGTLRWMAPEQRAEIFVKSSVIRPKPANDWYSFGMLLMAGLTGQKLSAWRRPGEHYGFPVADLVACHSFLSQVQDEDGKTLPIPLINLVLRLLEERPESRPSADQVLPVLHDLLGFRYFPPIPRIFEGRERELKRLGEERDKVRLGRVIVQIVDGEAACGKSSLTEHFLIDRRSEHDVVLRGRCSPSVTMSFEGSRGLVRDLLKFLLECEEAVRQTILRGIDGVAIDWMGMGPIGFARLEEARPYRKVERFESDNVRRVRGVQSLRGVLKNLGTFLRKEGRTLILWIDDLHWLDGDSADLLAELLLPPEPPPLLFLGCRRQEHRDSAEKTNLDDLLITLSRAKHLNDENDKSIDIKSLQVRPLLDSDARVLATHLIRRSEDPEEDATDPRFLDRMIAESQRMPLFLEQLAEYKLRRPDMSLDEFTLARAQGSNFRSLPSDARRLVRFLSLSDLPFLYAPDAYAGAGLDDATKGRKAQAILVAFRWIVEESPARHRHAVGRDEQVPLIPQSPPALAVYHDVQRDMIRSWRPRRLSRNPDLLLRVIKASRYPYRARDKAKVYEGAGLCRSDSNEQAKALLEAAELFETAGREENGERGDSQNRLPPEDAITCFQKAFDYRTKYEPHAEDDQYRLLDSLALAQARAGHTNAASENYLKALILATRLGRDPRQKDVVDLRLRAAECFLISGRIREGMKHYDEILEQVGMKLPRWPLLGMLQLVAERWLLEVFRSASRLVPIGLVRAAGVGWLLPPGQRSQDYPLAESQDRLKSDIIRICWSSTAMSVIDTIRSACFQFQALKLALKRGDPYLATRATAAEASYLAAFGRDAEADQYLDEAHKWLGAIPEALATERLHAASIIKLSQGIIAYSRGKWDDTRIYCERSFEDLLDCSAIGVAWERKTAKMVRLWSLFQQGMIADLRKDEVIKSLLDQQFPPRKRIRPSLSDQLSVSDRVSLVGANVMVLLARGLSAPSKARELLDRSEREWKDSCPNGVFYIQHHTIHLARLRIDLYERKATQAWKMSRRMASYYRRSCILRVKQIRIERLSVLACVALSIADGTLDARERRRFLKIALHYQKAFDQISGSLQANAFSQLVSAQISRICGEPGATQALANAASSLSDAGLLLHMAAAELKVAEWGREESWQAHRTVALKFAEIHGIKDFPEYAKAFVPAT